MEFKVEIPFELISSEPIKWDKETDTVAPGQADIPEEEKNATRFIWGVRSRSKPEMFVLLSEAILLNDLLKDQWRRNPTKHVAEIVWEEVSKAAALDLIHYAGIGARAGSAKK